jgi:hypothetical protein
VVVVVLIPVTTSAGEWLEKNVDQSPLVREHAERGDSAIFVGLPIAVLALVIWWRGREIDALMAARTAETEIVPAAIDGVGPASGVATTERTATRHRLLLAPQSTLVGVVIAALSVVAAGAAVYDTYLIGDSGAQATWQGHINAAPTGGDNN